MAWQADTWYWIEWVFVWGQQQRIRVWPAGDSVPTDWTLTVSSSLDARSRQPSFSVGLKAADGSTSAYFDDFSFVEPT